MREDVWAKGRRYLTEGRLTVTRLGPRALAAICKGESGDLYGLGFRDGGWWCSCPAKRQCSHLVALQLVVLKPGGIL